MRDIPMPEIGEKYQRLYGDRQIVTVHNYSPEGMIMIKDSNGVHFVSVTTFYRYFRKVKQDLQ